MSEIIVDFDDFYETNNRLDLLFQLKATIPGFKVNLFTVVGKCTPKFLAAVKEISWIDMIPHGLNHDTAIECKEWDYEMSKAYLDMVDKMGLTKGFKAPGWQISDGMYEALIEKGYWVADQPYNNERRPRDLRHILVTDSRVVHGHIQNVCGNGLEETFDELLKLRGDFKFIKDVIK